MIIRKKGSERGIYEDFRRSTRRCRLTIQQLRHVSVRCMSCTSPAPPAAWSFSQVSMLGDVVENAQFLHISIKNWMGPYQRTPKKVTRAIKYPGLGVRSVGPVGDFLEYWLIWALYYLTKLTCCAIYNSAFIKPPWCRSQISIILFWCKPKIKKRTRAHSSTVDMKLTSLKV